MSRIDDGFDFESDGQILRIFADASVWTPGERTITIHVGNYMTGPTLDDETAPAPDGRVYTVFQIRRKHLGEIINALDEIGVEDVADAAKAIAEAVS